MITGQRIETWARCGVLSVYTRLGGIARRMMQSTISGSTGTSLSIGTLPPTLQTEYPAVVAVRARQPTPLCCGVLAQNQGRMSGGRFLGAIPTGVLSENSRRPPLRSTPEWAGGGAEGGLAQASTLGLPHRLFAEYSGSRPDLECHEVPERSGVESPEYPESSVMMAETHTPPENRCSRDGGQGKARTGRRSARPYHRRGRNRPAPHAR